MGLFEDAVEEYVVLRQDPHGQGREHLVCLEYLYQALKARLIAELLVDVHGAPNYGRLVDDGKPDKR